MLGRGLGLGIGLEMRTFTDNIVIMKHTNLGVMLGLGLRLGVG